MGVIDIHTHAFPDGLAKRAMKSLTESSNWKPFLDGRIKSLVKSMDKADIDVSVVCTIATKPEQAEGILQWCKEIRSERIEPFPSVHPDQPGAAEFVACIAEEGFVGIKLHPLYQQFAGDEERVLPIYRAAAEAGLAVAIHCGHDVSWDDTVSLAAPYRFRNALAAVPGLKLIATHMGGFRMWDESAASLVGQDCYLETSFSLDRLEPARAIEMIRAHGVDKVLFGTDSPWADQKAEIQRLRTLGLEPAEVDKILFTNAARLLRF